jgi:hypothetical protein
VAGNPGQAERNQDDRCPGGTGEGWQRLGPERLASAIEEQDREPTTVGRGESLAANGRCLQGYDTLVKGTRIVLVGCWAHARQERYSDSQFVEARRAVLGPHLENLRAWMDERAAQTLPSGAAGKALSYSPATANPCCPGTCVPEPSDACVGSSGFAIQPLSSRKIP